MISEVKRLLDEKKYLDVRELLMDEEAADIGILFSQFPPEEVTLMFRILPKQLASEVFVEMETDMQQALIEAFTDIELTEIIDTLFLDDTVDIVEEMPANVVKRILKHATVEKRAMINQLLHYPEDSAGTIMTTEFVELKAYMKVSDAFESIRESGLKKELIYTCYVTDQSRRLLGLVSVKQLLLADENEIIEDIMETNIISVNTLDDKEDVAKMFDKYGFLAIPVVDAENRLVGIVTVDDAIDVIQEEYTEDLEKMAAILPSEDSYLKIPAWKHARNRIMWLLFLMLSATITGSILQYYENAFVAIPILVAFVPMLMGTAGNCSSQSSTTIIRGLALDEIKTRDFFKVLFKECSVALMSGVTLALVNAARVFIMYCNNSDVLGQISIFKLIMISGLSLVGTVVLAKSLGCILPILAKKIKIDPALMAAPLLSTILDACSVLIFFNIATHMLGL